MISWLKRMRGRGAAPLDDFNGALKRARRWIEDNSSDEGVFHTNRNRVVYREVTGYCIPTLLKLGDRRRAVRWGRYLLDHLEDDGAVIGVDGLKYVFDTAQVLRGFLALCHDPNFSEGVGRTMSYLVSQLDNQGSFPDPYGGCIPAYIFLYCLPPMMEAAKFGPQMWSDKTNLAVDYYRRMFRPEDFNANSHFYGYAAEALYDLGHKEWASRCADVARTLIRRNGAMWACQGVRWISSPGQAQFASIFYKLGDMASGDRLVGWLIKKQRESGGFYGAYGRGTLYFTDQEPAWAVKFFIDALLLRIRKHFELEFPARMDRREAPDDFRLRALMAALPTDGHLRILEIGCGNGRFLKQLCRVRPGDEYHGVDLSKSLVSLLPPDLHGRQGDMMALPYNNQCFDAVFMIESLEHAPDWKDALAEAVRVLRTGGRLIIIDKNVNRLGAIEVMPWERWFDPNEVVACLRDLSVEARVVGLPMPNETECPPLFALWTGRRA